MDRKKSIWLIGTGLMGVEYAKVLNQLDCTFIVIGRGKENCQKFLEQTKVNCEEGGLSKFLQSKPKMPDGVIVAVGIEALTEVTCQLLEYGATNILLEKPGVGDANEIYTLTKLAKEKKQLFCWPTIADSIPL